MTPLTLPMLTLKNETLSLQRVHSGWLAVCIGNASHRSVLVITSRSLATHSPINCGSMAIWKRCYISAGRNSRCRFATWAGVATCFTHAIVPRTFRPRNRHSKSNKTDVIVACFGMGESFAGEAGLQEFRAAIRRISFNPTQARPTTANLPYDWFSSRRLPMSNMATDTESDQRDRDVAAYGAQ